MSLISINQAVVEMSQNQVVAIGKWKFQKYRGRFCSVHPTLPASRIGTPQAPEAAATSIGLVLHV